MTWGAVEGFDPEIIHSVFIDRIHDRCFERLASNAVLEREAFEIFHNEEGLTVLLVDFMDSADAGMV